MNKITQVHPQPDGTMIWLQFGIEENERFFLNAERLLPSLEIESIADEEAKSVFPALSAIVEAKDLECHSFMPTYAYENGNFFAKEGNWEALARLFKIPSLDLAALINKAAANDATEIIEFLVAHCYPLWEAKVKAARSAMVGEKSQHPEKYTAYDLQADLFAERHGVKMVVRLPEHGKHFGADDYTCYIFPVTFKRGGKRMAIRFGQSVAAGSRKPRLYDVLACLGKDDYPDFKDFCGAYGYDEDSRRSEKVWKAYQKEFAAVERVFGDCLDDLRQIY